MQDFQKHVVSAGGCLLEYVEAGRGHALVFLHGGGIHASRPAFDQALLDRLPDLQAPTFLVWGSADRLIPPNHARYYAGIPDQRLVIVDGGPHVLSAGAPDAFVASVREFLGVRFTGAEAAATL